jgi:hypothetical protein
VRLHQLLCQTLCFSKIHRIDIKVL